MAKHQIKTSREPRIHYGLEETVVLPPLKGETLTQRARRLDSNLAIDREGFIELRTEFKEHREQTDRNFEEVKGTLKSLDEMKTQFVAHVTSDAIIFKHLTETLDKVDQTLNILTIAHQQDIGSKITKKQIWSVLAGTLILIPAIITILVHFLFTRK